jgi:hypothetical protein
MGKEDFIMMEESDFSKGGFSKQLCFQTGSVSGHLSMPNMSKLLCLELVEICRKH